jgi:hypothetical protein
MAARTPGANPESTWRLYSALAEHAGVSRPVTVHDPRVVVGMLRQPQGDTAVFVNCSTDTVVVEPVLAADARTALTPAPFALGPLRVAVVRGADGTQSQPVPPVAGTTASREGSDARGSR